MPAPTGPPPGRARGERAKLAETDVTIRRYARRDRAAVLEITRSSFGGFCLESGMEEKFGLLDGTDWAERKCAGIDYDLRRHPEHALVAVAGGRVVGFVCTRVYSDYSIGHVANMAVHKDSQGQGIGRALLEAALHQFRRQGLRYARIETLEHNARGRELYPSCGFTEVGRQIFYFREI